MKKRICALMAAAVLLLITASGSLALDAREQDFSKSAAGGAEITFSKADFVNHVAGGPALEGIVLAQLPAPETGVLKCGARTMMSGEAIIAGALDGLKFVPAVSGDVSATFSFLPVYDGNAGEKLVTVELNLITRPNRPPMAEDMSLVTYKNIAISKLFKGNDPDGDPLTYKVTGKPKRGVVELLDDGAFRYTPYQNKTGSDSFTYVACDPFGNVSPEAKVELKIDKPGAKVTYADMYDHPGYYAAIKLSEAGIFTGEKLGDQYYFCPDQPVSRGEFITMVMAMLGQNDPPRVLQTGFSDDSATKAWVMPYAAAALKAGIVQGVMLPDGRRELRADSEITRAEAAVILNNALKAADAGMQVFADWDTAPVWAQQPAVNMRAAGVMDAYYDGTMRLESPVSRADAAELILAAIEVKEQSEPKKGLLSWVFG